jgi:hypothetical protein
VSRTDGFSIGFSAVAVSLRERQVQAAVLMSCRHMLHDSKCPDKDDE